MGSLFIGVAASALLLLLRLALRVAADGSDSRPLDVSELVRIPLLHHDGLNVCGRVRVGSEALRVVFDTGSSESWVSTRASAGAGPREPFGRRQEGLAVHYGGGRVAYREARLTALRLEASSPHAELTVPPVWLGYVDRDSAVLAEIRADGVLGLGMEALQQWTQGGESSGQSSGERGDSARRRPLLLEQLADGAAGASLRSSRRPLVFSIFIGWAEGAEDRPASQLILGGSDPDLVHLGSTWKRFPVVPYAPTGAGGYGFWAVRLHSVSLGGRRLLSGGPHGRAVVDSGSSLLLLPPPAFRAASDALARQLGARFACWPRDLAAFRSRECVCRRCSAHEFPDLAVSLGSDSDAQALVLRGADYVRCDRRRRRLGDCALLLDEDASASDGRVVLGAVFLRAFYSRFDYSNKEVALARSAQHGNSSSSSERGPATAWQPVAAALAVVGTSVLCLSLASRWVDAASAANAAAA